jgi:hypothetical protein
MITVRLKIGSGSIVDTKNYGLIYIDSDKVVGPQIKDFESTQYPEEEGEHIIPKTVDAPFEYKVKFFIQANSLSNANNLIDTFNASLYSQTSGSDIKTFSQVTFFNDYKRHKIVGYPSPISEATEFWRPNGTSHLNDIVIVEWKIRVTQPSLCEFSTPFTEDTPSSQSTT